MGRVVILGAGLTGLSAAYHLQLRGEKPQVFEQADRVGGVCRTEERDGFFFDYTGHLLHLARPESLELLGELGVKNHLATHRRRAGIALAGVITPYPIQIHTHRLPPAIRRDCVLGFVEAYQSSVSVLDDDASFVQWVKVIFGEGFARHFFLPYNEKLFCTKADELTTDWVGRYIPKPSLADVINGAFGLYRQSVGYNATFYYPRRGGVACIAEALGQRVEGLHLGCPVREVHLGRREVVLDSNEVVPWRDLIATTALSQLAAMTVDLPAAAQEAAHALRAADVVNVNLGVNGPAPRREHWLYVPEPQFPFYRVGFPSNHGKLAPVGCHTISVEVSVGAGGKTPDDVIDKCLVGLGELGLLRDRSDVLTTHLLRISPAYVVFNRHHQDALATLRQTYESAGVVLAGRWAEWKYSAMEDALWDGVAAARQVAP